MKSLSKHLPLKNGVSETTLVQMDSPKALFYHIQSVTHFVKHSCLNTVILKQKQGFGLSLSHSCLSASQGHVLELVKCSVNSVDIICNKMLDAYVTVSSLGRCILKNYYFMPLKETFYYHYRLHQGFYFSADQNDY